MLRSPRKVAAVSAWIVGAALVTATLPAGAASAESGRSAQTLAVSAKPLAGALAAPLGPGERSVLLKAAEANVARTAAALHLDAQEKLQPRSVLKDADGTVHTRYERTFAGLPVLGGDLVVHTAPDGSIKGVDKAARGSVAVASTTPAHSADSAKGLAVGRAEAAGAKQAKADSVRSVVWTASGTPVLAWETVVGGLQPDGTPNALHVITDATTGAKLFEYQAIETGSGTGQYNGKVTIGTTKSGSGWTMTDGARGNHRTYDLKGAEDGTGTLFTNANDVWGNGKQSNRQTAAVDVAFGAQATWDYYKNVHGRTGINDDGKGSSSRVHYGDGYVNAFWDDDCFCMTYGDGDNNANPLTSLDVAAHEMTHGVTAATAKLNYSGESGGLNEATSDIMATAVEFNVNSAADPGDYLIGEKINVYGNGEPLRYMDKPSKDGYSKDYWHIGLGDIDVHYSSGPANHWFYLASEGSGHKVVNGVTYDSPTADNRPVTPIGRDAAANIWYRALTTYMTSTTDYAGARTATLKAAADLYGLNSVTYVNTANAWAGVAVGSRMALGVSVADPGTQESVVNQAASLQIQASSTNPGALSYAATGLPAGLSINASTGLISGTPTKLGTSSVTVKATDSTGAASTATFTWKAVSVLTTFENTTDVPIPDEGPAVYSDIVVSGRTGNAPSTLTVDVDIKHPWRGDVVVDLVAPDGTAYRLKERSPGDGGYDVIATYKVNASSEPANGTWRLKVQDMYAELAGYIDSWKLTF
ncbi:M4 family metallopeptidase [Kitasatospora paracochleata]|uniref:Zn-dependent metalloprotease n=1 Tax=Kitasatospora paracochleata TaxID=58354 RepID=A0ABT1IW85_9ACTN|nr:M4 family metallopeptidase [Kitasatospora paracochleata]MCP2309410.1 Zn-dependent metalloprotease [Kitasatospora paracochleata]